MAGTKGRKPLIGDKARTEKIMFYVTPEMISDFKTVSFIKGKTMVENVIALMEQEIKDHASELEAFKAIQNGQAARKE